MGIPDYQSIMLPLLEFAADKQEHSLRNAIEYISKHFKLTETERKELLPSGRQAVIDNRVGWARTYMKKAGLLVYPKRGYFKITERGLQALSENPEKIDLDYLMQFEEFQEFRQISKTTEETNVKLTPVETKSDLTPIEMLEQSYQAIRNELKSELLEQLSTVSPDFFEKLVVELLVKMGYGGDLKDAGMAIGKTGDEGIDGVIKEDKLGLDNIYIQAKRWQNNVGRPVIQSFVGALQGKKARRGILITTSSFTSGAIEYANMIETKVVLIDGERLVDLMVDYGLGVSTRNTYDVKEIDQDYFIE